MLENQELKFIPYDLENAILDLQPGKEIAIITDHKNLFKVDNEEEKHYIDIIEKGKYKQTIKGYIVDSDTNGLIAKVNNIKGLIPNYLINSETELDKIGRAHV